MLLTALVVASYVAVGLAYDGWRRAIIEKKEMTCDTAATLEQGL